MLDRIKPNMQTPISSDRCPICDGTGWEQITAEDGRKYSRECSCVKVRRCREYMRRSGLEDVLEALTFEAFKTPENWQKNAVERAKEYASSIIEAAAKREKKPWFYIGDRKSVV